MTPRELTEKAAELMGFGPCDLRWDDDWNCMTDYEGWTFDPLNDDADCSRLEARMRLNVVWQDQHVIVGSTPLEKWQEPYAIHKGDAQAARRYAAIRAAIARNPSPAGRT